MLCLGYEKSIWGKEGWRGVIGEWGRNREQWMKTKSWKVKITQNNLWFFNSVHFLMYFLFISRTILPPLCYIPHFFMYFLCISNTETKTKCSSNGPVVFCFIIIEEGDGRWKMKTRREVWRRKGEEVFCLVFSGYVGP